jgi:nucleoside-triphosphatase THEP1
LDVQDVRTGERRHLAQTTGSARGPTVGKWRFHSDALDWGADILRCATPCDVLVIDELGPLELTRNLGWTVACDVLRAGGYRTAVVVVRPTLMDAARDRIGDRHGRSLVLSESNRHVLSPCVHALVGAEP